MTVFAAPLVSIFSSCLFGFHAVGLIRAPNRSSALTWLKTKIYRSNKSADSDRILGLQLQLLTPMLRLRRLLSVSRRSCWSSFAVSHVLECSSREIIQERHSKAH